MHTLYLQIPWNRLYTSRMNRQTGYIGTLRPLYRNLESCCRGQRHVTLVSDVGSKDAGDVPISRMHFDESPLMHRSEEVWRWTTGYGDSW